MVAVKAAATRAGWRRGAMTVVAMVVEVRGSGDGAADEGGGDGGGGGRRLWWVEVAAGGGSGGGGDGGDGLGAATAGAMVVEMAEEDEVGEAAGWRAVMVAVGWQGWYVGRWRRRWG